MVPSASSLIGGAMENETIIDAAHRTGRDCTGFDAERYSFLIAQGQIDLLFDVPDDQMETVVALVREHGRANLVRHIARSIAAELSATDALEE
jgi:hypothetical protein